MPIKTTNNIIPIKAIMRIGRTDSEVIPLTARAKHFCERIFRLAVNPGKPVVCNGRSPETELNNESAQEYVRFAVK